MSAVFRVCGREKEEKTFSSTFSLFLSFAALVISWSSSLVRYDLNNNETRRLVKLIDDNDASFAVIKPNETSGIASAEQTCSTLVDHFVAKT
jgi:hypothetical protein